MTSQPDNGTVSCTDYAHLPYRQCVGIMLVNSEDLIWVGRRINGVLAPGATEAWQMPQGGVDPGEDVRAAAFRELGEETGTDRAELITETPHWLNYDLPVELIGKIFKGKYRGQTQKWFIMRFTGKDHHIRIDRPLYDAPPEFNAWRWVDSSELLQLIVPFKRPVYEAVVKEYFYAIKS